MIGSDKFIVGVVGTANTGKTTFIKDVVESDWNKMRDKDYAWTTYGKDYREIISSRGLSINRNGNEECQKVIHETLKNNILEAVNEPFLRRIIMDRTIIDSFAYTYWHYRYGTAYISTDTLSKMWSDVVQLSKLYTRILYIPLDKCVDINVVDDKFRDTNFDYRKQIDAIFHSILSSLYLSDMNYHNIMDIYGSRAERVEWFIRTETIMNNDYNRLKDNFDNSMNVFDEENK